MPGFETNRFTDLNESLTKHLICSICLNIFDNAVRSRCEHTFCKNCVQQLIESNHKECPECRVKFTTRKRSDSMRSPDNSVLIGNRVFKSNLLANSMVSELTIKCDFDFNGCQQSVKLGLLSTHVKDCPHRLCAKCGFGFIENVEHNCIELLKNDRNGLKDKYDKQLKVNEELKAKYEKQLEVNNGLKGKSENQLKNINELKEENNELKTKLETIEKQQQNKTKNSIDWRQRISSDEEWDPYMPSNSRARIRKALSDSDEDLNERPERPKRLCKKQAKKMREITERQELIEIYNSFKELHKHIPSPNWYNYSQPLLPQMGDKVVYFRSGHQHYIDRVRQMKIYSIDPNLKPCELIGSQSDEIFAKIVDISFDVRPPPVVTFKMVAIDPQTNEMTNYHFSVCYHKIEGVSDFIILKGVYDRSVSREWKFGDEFRSIIETFNEEWRFGTIQGLSNPSTLFKCFEVLWANGDTELLSPWDLKPINKKRVPQNRTESVVVTEKEENLFFLVNNVEEWPQLGKAHECKRILDGLVRIMGISEAEEFQFLYPPEHRFHELLIAYPIDLDLISSALECHHYRRVDAIKFDVQFIELNAKLSNERGSETIKKAKLITHLIIRFIEDQLCFDPMPIYLELIENYEQFDEPIDNGEEDLSLRRRLSTNSDPNFGLEVRVKRRPWKQNCLQLLNLILDKEESAPFRSPIDLILYPDYSQVIDSPMDLMTVKERLHLYDSPHKFCKDMRLIFSNSKSYNTNRKSSIYSTTVSLSQLFEQKIKPILSDHRSDLTYQRNLKRGIEFNSN